MTIKLSLITLGAVAIAIGAVATGNAVRNNRPPATAVDGAEAGLAGSLDKQLPSVHIAPSPIHGDYTGTDYLGLHKKFLS
jgi:hypothetical protein